MKYKKIIPLFIKKRIRRFRLYMRCILKQDIWPKTDLRLQTKEFGNDGAAWTFCPSVLKSDSIVYSFGVGNDISFDLEMIAKLGLKVHAFDPTPRVVEWISQQILPSNFYFHPFGLAAMDGEVSFKVPVNPNKISHSMVRDGLELSDKVIVNSLSSCMARLGNKSIDLLKMDIEGAEYEVIESLSRSSIRPKQLLVEFHHRWPEVGIDRSRKAIKTLKEMGYRCFSVSDSGDEWSFYLEK